MTPVPREIWRFDTRHIGRQVFVHDELPSTNDAAAELATDPESTGSIVLADLQSAGRGQYGRTWQSRRCDSVLMSVVVPSGVERPVVLTAWAAVAVTAAVRQLTGVTATIKWPNDVLVGTRKVCGVLIERRHGAAAVAGIGLNVNQSLAEFAAADLPEATSLAILAGQPVDPQTAVGVLVKQLDAEFSRLLDLGLAPLESDWRRRLGLLGRQVVAELADGSSADGRVRQVGFDGLELEAGDGVFRVLAPETIRRVRSQ